MKNPVALIRRWRWFIAGRLTIKKQIASAISTGKLKIVIGSGTTSFAGWIATDLPHFNILKEADWEYFFSKSKIDHLLAEHVLEHLTEPEVEKVLQLAFRYLKVNAIFRIAVPDGFHRDADYQDHADPKGNIGALHQHKSLWNYKAFSALAHKTGFDAHPLEYYDEQGNYKLNEFTDENGWIMRTGKRSKRGLDQSLVVDLLKNKQ